MDVYVEGGDGDHSPGVQVDNETTGVTGGAIRLPAGSAIKLFYSIALSWNWLAG